MVYYLRFSIAFLFTLLACLPARSDVFEDIRNQDGFVPYETTKKLAEEKAFVCYNFDDVTKRCGARGKITTWWFEPANEATIPISLRGSISVRIIFQYEEFDGPDGFGCYRTEGSNIKSINFDVPWKHRSNQRVMAALEKMESDILLAKDPNDSEFCTAHFYSGSSFEPKAYTLNGKELPNTGFDYVKFTNIKYKLLRSAR